MLYPKPKDFQLLLEVFRRGLALRLISKNDVIDWADNIIKNTAEPDFFFIELSMGRNANQLIEVITRNIESNETQLAARVLLGRVCKRILDDNDSLTVEDAAKLMGTLNSFDTLTSFEQNKIYMFDEYDTYYLPDLTQLQVEIIYFLSIYKDFHLENYAQWSKINVSVEELLKQEEAEEFVVNESIKNAWEKKRKKKKLKRNVLRGLVLIFFLVL